MTEQKSPQPEKDRAALEAALNKNARAMNARMDDAFAELNERLGLNTLLPKEEIKERKPHEETPSVPVASEKPVSSEDPLEGQKVLGRRRRKDRQEEGDRASESESSPVIASSEKEISQPLLSEGAEKFYVDQDGLVWKVERQGDLYKFSGIEGDGTHHDSGFVYDETMIRTFVSDWKESIFLEVPIAPQPDPVTPEPTAPPAAAPEALAPKDGKEPEPAWTLDRLMIEIPDQGRFELQSPESSKMIKYSRKGNEFLNKKGLPVTDQVLERLNQGWRLSLIEVSKPEPVAEVAETSVPTPAPVPENPSREEKKGTPDLEKAVQEMARAGEAERAREQQEASKVPEAPKEEAPVDNLQEKIDGLATEVQLFRAQYARMDYEKRKIWSSLKNIFRGLKADKEVDGDSEYWKSEYNASLNKLLDAELEKIKRSGVKGQELKDQMAGLLVRYKLEEATALYDERTLAMMDSRGAIRKTWDKWKEIVGSYRDARIFTKLLVGAGFTGAAFLTGGASIAAARLLSGTSLYLGVEVALEVKDKLKDQKKKEESLKDFDQEMSEKNLDNKKDVEQVLEAFQQKLGKEIEGLNKKLQQKKLEALRRKSIAAGAAVGLVGGVTLASHMLHPTPGSMASSSEAASAPEQASSTPAGGTAESAASTAETTPDQGFKVEFDRYDVTPEDGKRGLWGILEQHLPEDMLPQAEKNRIIQSLENVIQQKLDHMSPAELKEVGFPTGNINNIYAGTQIDLGKLLTPDEVQAVMEGKNIALPHAEVASQVAEPSPTARVTTPVPQAAPVEPTVKNKPILDRNSPFHSGSSGIAAPEAVHEKVSFTDPKAYLREHPEALNRYNGTLGRLRMGIFMMPAGDNGVPMEYDYTLNGEKLGNTKIADVVRDLKGFGRGFLQNLDYDRVKNPLHYDQMRELGKFLEASEKAFGPEVAAVQDGETIDHYTRRMATAALRMGKEIKGFYKP